jgi:protein tyrosine/serine phosphatase
MLCYANIDGGCSDTCWTDRDPTEREADTKVTLYRKENMIATLEIVRQTYGSVEQYVVHHCGLSKAQVEQLRRNLTVDAGDNEPLDWKKHAKLV